MFADLFGRRRLKKRSEKTEIARPNKETMKKGKSRGEGKRRHKKKRSPLPPRHATWTRSHRTCTDVHACGKILDKEFERFRGREGKALPKAHAVIFGNCADIDRKRAMRKTPRKDEIFNVDKTESAMPKKDELETINNIVAKNA